MRRARLSAAVLAVALGAACTPVNRKATTVYVGHPRVEHGVFLQTKEAPGAWVFDPDSPMERRVPVYVTPDTDILLNGTYASLQQLEPGRLVRLVYELRHDGTAVAERIDVIGPPQPGAPLDVGL